MYGVPLFDNSQSLQSYVADVGRYHDSIARCMQEQGFDYVQTGTEEVRQLWPRELLDDLDQGMSEREYAGKYGFGIAPILLLTEALSAEHAVVGDPDDPNFDQAAFDQRIKEMAGRSDQYPDEDTPEGDAYWKALVGDDGGGGCSEEASAILRGHNAKVDLQADIDQRRERFLADGRVVGFYQEWAECMTALGFKGYDSPMSYAVMMEASIEADYEAFLANSETIADEEIAAAKATLDCGGSVMNLLPAELISVWSEYTDPTWWTES